MIGKICIPQISYLVARVACHIIKMAYYIKIFELHCRLIDKFQHPAVCLQIIFVIIVIPIIRVFSIYKMYRSYYLIKVTTRYKISAMFYTAWLKPYLYALAMENGYTPCDLAPNVQQTYIVAGQPWTPRNSGKARYGEMVTLKWGLQQSNNWISAYLMSKLSPQAFVDLLHEYGIRNPEIHPSMSLCLGPCDISVGEMASAYTAFVNHGIRAALMFVTRIEDNEGNVVAQFQPRMNEVISEESAHKMLYMLQSVVDGGTAGRLRFRYNLKAQLAGKTGTTNNNSDAWFMGLTPNLVNACWVGGDDRDIHFDSMAMGQGASMALPIFALYMQKVYADNRLGYTEDAVFDIPAGFNPCPLSDGTTDDDDVNGIEEIFE